MMSAKLAISVAVFVASNSVLCGTCWSQSEISGSHEPHRADFDGDGVLDVLYVPTSPEGISAIALGDPAGGLTVHQSWRHDYLGIRWSTASHAVTVADFSGDGRADIFLQPVEDGTSFLLLTSVEGTVLGISQELRADAFGFSWSAAQSKLIAGDFTAAGRHGVLLQTAQRGGVSAIFLPDENGQLTLSPRQTWGDGYLGLRWSTQDSVIEAGDFNGDARDDLLIRAHAVPAADANDALDVSLQVGANSPTRVGIDYARGEFVVFMEHAPGMFHGHVRAWGELTQRMQAVLRQAGMADRRGRILMGE